VTMCYAVPHTMDVSVRELRNHTARVIRAVEAGERVVLTVHGRPVADIVPRVERSERRPSSVFLRELAELSALAEKLGIESRPEDFDTGLTIDDMLP
jgi:prevent-host-death family protein